MPDGTCLAHSSGDMSGTLLGGAILLMNKSTVERLTEGRVIKPSRETYSLYYSDLVDLRNVSEFIFGPIKGKKESVAFQKLHDLFWDWRRKQILDRDKHRCVECGSPFGVSVDHIKNRSQGGTHNQLNLQTLCAEHHRAKTYNEGKWKMVRS